MKKDKLTYKSNANIRNFSIDDIGKLSINDIKKLKDMFGPKQRKSTKKREKIDEYNDIPNNPVRSSSDHMVGSSRSMPSPFFRGALPNPNNLLMLENQVDNSRVANKSNLNTEDIYKAIQSNMNPLLENMRNDARTQLLTEFKPYLENFDNTTRFIQNDYQKFRNETDRDIRDLYSMNQDDNSKPIIEIFDDDAGNFGGTKGSDNFISLDDKVPDGIKTGMHPDDYEEKLRKLENIVNLSALSDSYEINDNINNYIDDNKDSVNYAPDYFVEDVDNNSEEELEQEPEPEPEPEYKKTKSKKPKIDFEKIKKTDNFKYYMNGNIKSTEAVELYKALGGKDTEIINAKGKGSINKIKGGISSLLKNKHNYYEKAITRDAKTKEYKQF